MFITETLFTKYNGLLIAMFEYYNQTKVMKNQFK